MIAGGLLALLAAATFALNNASFRRGAVTGSALQAMAISLSLGLAWFLMAMLLGNLWDRLAAFPPGKLVMLSAAGLLHFVWGRYCNFRATKAIGANLVAPVQQSSLIISLVLAITVLGEALTPLRILGIVLVMLGAAVSVPRSENPASPKFQPNYVEGYTFAALSALGYGSSPVLVRMALENGGLAASIAGGFVAHLAAAAILPLVLIFKPGLLGNVRAVGRGTAGWYVASAVLVTMSQMFGYMALALAPVSVVIPIQRLSLVFRVYANSVLNPDHEIRGGRVWAATWIALAGALALSLSAEALGAALRLPELLRGMLPSS